MSVVKQMFTVLITVGLLSSLVLAASYKFTEPRKLQNEQEELRQSIFKVLPQADSYEQIDTDTPQIIYKAFNENKELVGYAFVAQGPGFQGEIRMLVGIDPDLDDLTGMRVLKQSETPGLGAKIAEVTPKEDFFEQFDGLDINEAAEEQAQAPTEGGEAEAPDYIIYVKNAPPDDPNEIQAITGATISSVAVVEIINQELMKLRKTLNP